MHNSKRSPTFRAPMAAMMLLGAAALVLAATPSSATGIGEGPAHPQQLRGSSSGSHARSLLRDRIGISTGAQAPGPATALSAEAPLQLTCSASNECPEETYCATGGICLPIGGCNDLVDCQNPFNGPYPTNLCLGTDVCEDGFCGIDCTQIPEDPTVCPIDQPRPNAPCTKFERGLTCPYQFLYKGCSWGELRCEPTTNCYCSEQDPGFFSWTCMMEFIADCPEPEPVESEFESESAAPVAVPVPATPAPVPVTPAPVPVTPAPIATVPVPAPPVDSPNDNTEGCSFCAAGQRYETDPIIRFESNNDSVSCAGLFDLINSGLSADFCESERDAIEAACCENIDEPVTVASARQAPIATDPAEGCSFCAGGSYESDSIIQFSSNNDSVSCAGLSDLVRSGLSPAFCDSERDAIEAACCESVVAAEAEVAVEPEPVVPVPVTAAPVPIPVTAAPVPVPAPIATVPAPLVDSPSKGCSFCAAGQRYGTDPIIQFENNDDSVSCAGLLDLISSGLSTQFCEIERVAIEAACCEDIDEPVTAPPTAAKETGSRPPKERDPEELPRGFCDPGVPLPPPPPSAENPECPIAAPNGVTSCEGYPVGAECQYGHKYTGCSWDTLQCSWMQLCTCSPNGVFICAVAGLELCTEEVVIGGRAILVDIAPGNLPREESCDPDEELPTAMLDGGEGLENDADIVEGDIVVDNGKDVVGINVPDEDNIEVITAENAEGPAGDTVEDNIGAEFEGPVEDIGEDVDGRLSDECPPDYEFGSCSGYVPGLSCGYNYINTGCSWDTIACTAVMDCTCGSLLFGGGDWICRSLSMVPCETKPDGFPENKPCDPNDPLPSGPSSGSSEALPLLDNAVP